MKITKICVWCEKKFVPRDSKPSHAQRRRVCSRKCHTAVTAAVRAQKVERLAPEPEPVDGARWLAISRDQFMLVDEDVFDDVNRFNWSFVNGYARSGRAGVLHRYIMSAESNEEVDHRDGNKWDNRRSNLRKTNRRGNRRNVKKGKARSDHPSKYKGVTLSKCNTWEARITSHRKCIYIGRYKTEEDAAKAYDEMARRIFGAFGTYNFPRTGERSALH